MLSKEDLGKYLKELRNNRHLSLREVDNITGISYSHLNMIENGKRNVTPALLRVLSNLYRVDYLDLYEKAGISTILVAGSSGAFFHIADTIIQMDCYKAIDITASTKVLCKENPLPKTSATEFHQPDSYRIMSTPDFQTKT